MNIGRLRHRIVFQRKTQMRDRFNAEKEEWADVFYSLVRGITW